MSRKITRVIYLLLGVVFPILVGALHTWTHFKDLTIAHVEIQLTATIDIMGTQQSLWNTWGLMSFMMGVSFIIIGLLHLVLFQKQNRHDYPSPSGWYIILLYLLGVVYAAKTFSAVPQFYGGIMGLGLALLCLVLSLKGRTETRQTLT
ncbi:MAG: hypothetical protein HRU41_06215 [Saprospiraceae bacterium]|nr:hypothetical protein [Saprospiraceae bacterium]